MPTNTRSASGGEDSASQVLAPYVTLGKSSLAVSPAASALEKRGTTLVQRIAEFLHRASAQAARSTTAANQLKTLLDIKLCAAFNAAPLEDGIDHPAESILQEALRSPANSPPAAETLRELCLSPERPAFGASILRCLGRLPDASTPEWRKQLVRDALNADNPEVRDAALQAAESWGGDGMAAVLREHDEPDAFLRQYQRQVAASL